MTYTYNKPKGVTYTQMAIKIDDMAYSDSCDDELLFEYLYHLSFMLAYKAKYFKYANQYDEFALYLASNAFLRLKNKKQYMLDADGMPIMSKIKSILNYLKKILYPKKVEFEQENYIQNPVDQKEECIGLLPGYTFANKLSDSADALFKVEFQCCLRDIDKTVRNTLKSIPYKYRSTEWYNIYISVMLSFLNSFILSRKDIDSLVNAKYKINDYNKLLETYEHKGHDFIILFNLDKTMKQYIHILVKIIKKSIADDLSFITTTQLNSNDLSIPILKQELNNSYEGIS